MPVPPGRPQLMTTLSSAALILEVRRLAPVGASSRCFSPFAKEPWQSAQPVFFQSSKPAFTLSASCATVARDPARMAMTTASATPPARTPRDKRTISSELIRATIVTSNTSGNFLSRVPEFHRMMAPDCSLQQVLIQMFLIVVTPDTLWFHERRYPKNARPELAAAGSPAAREARLSQGQDLAPAAGDWRDRTEECR